MRPAILVVLVALVTGTQGLMCMWLKSKADHTVENYEQCEEGEMCVLLSIDTYHEKDPEESSIVLLNPVKACATQESQEMVIKGKGWEKNKIQPFPEEVPVFNVQLEKGKWVVLKDMGAEESVDSYVVNNTAVLYCFADLCNSGKKIGNGFKHFVQPKGDASFYWIKVESMRAGVNLVRGTTCAWKPERSDYPREWEGNPAEYKSRYCPGVKCCGVRVEEASVAERFCPTWCPDKRDYQGYQWGCDVTKTNCTCANDGNLTDPPCDQGDTVDLTTITVVTRSTSTTTTTTTTTPATTTLTTTTPATTKEKSMNGGAQGGAKLGAGAIGVLLLARLL